MCMCVCFAEHESNLKPELYFSILPHTRCTQFYPCLSVVEAHRAIASQSVSFWRARLAPAHQRRDFECVCVRVQLSWESWMMHGEDVMHTHMSVRASEVCKYANVRTGNRTRKEVPIWFAHKCVYYRGDNAHERAAHRPTTFIIWRTITSMCVSRSYTHATDAKWTRVYVLIHAGIESSAIVEWQSQQLCILFIHIYIYTSYTYVCT